MTQQHIRKLSSLMTPTHKDLRIPRIYHFECPWPAAQHDILMINAYKVTSYRRLFASLCRGQPREGARITVTQLFGQSVFCVKADSHLSSLASPMRKLTVTPALWPVSFLCESRQSPQLFGQLDFCVKADSHPSSLASPMRKLTVTPALWPVP